MRAKKSLGQNFLKSKKALDAICDAGNITTTDTVLEIGPGKGALTSKLLERAGKVIAVEKDDELIPYLSELFAAEIEAKKLILIHADILEMPLEKLDVPAQYKIVANIPYYITGTLLRTFLSAQHQPRCMVLMLQKEVARRIVARDEKESLLSLSVKAYGAPQYIQTVEAVHFSPQPKVDSAIILIKNISKEFFTGMSEDHFFTVIKSGFAHKRKLLSRNLESSFSKDSIVKAFTALNLSEKTRAEDMPIETWKKLAHHLQ